MEKYMGLQRSPVSIVDVQDAINWKNRAEQLEIQQQHLEPCTIAEAINLFLLQIYDETLSGEQHEIKVREKINAVLSRNPRNLNGLAEYQKLSDEQSESLDSKIAPNVTTIYEFESLDEEDPVQLWEIARTKMEEALIRYFYGYPGLTAASLFRNWFGAMEKTLLKMKDQRSFLLQLIMYKYYCLLNTFRLIKGRRKEFSNEDIKMLEEVVKYFLKCVDTETTPCPEVSLTVLKHFAGRSMVLIYDFISELEKVDSTLIENKFSDLSLNTSTKQEEDNGGVYSELLQLAKWCVNGAHDRASLDVLNRAVGINPIDPWIIIRYANVVKLKDLPKAIELLDQLLASPSYYLEMDHELVTLAHMRLLAEFQYKVTLDKSLCSSMQLENRLDVLHQDYLTIMKRPPPSLMEPFFYKGWSLFLRCNESGDEESRQSLLVSSVTFFNRAIEFADDYDDILCDAYYFRARCLALLGKLLAALESLKAAIENWPGRNYATGSQIAADLVSFMRKAKCPEAEIQYWCRRIARSGISFNPDAPPSISLNLSDLQWTQMVSQNQMRQKSRFTKYDLLLLCDSRDREWTEYALLPRVERCYALKGIVLPVVPDDAEDAEKKMLGSNGSVASHMMQVIKAIDESATVLIVATHSFLLSVWPTIKEDQNLVTSLCRNLCKIKSVTYTQQEAKGAKSMLKGIPRLFQRHSRIEFKSETLDASRLRNLRDFIEHIVNGYSSVNSGAMQNSPGFAGGNGLNHQSSSQDFRMSEYPKDSARRYGANACSSPFRGRSPTNFAQHPRPDSPVRSNHFQPHIRGQGRSSVPSGSAGMYKSAVNWTKTTAATFEAPLGNNIGSGVYKPAVNWSEAAPSRPETPRGRPSLWASPRK